MNKPALFCLRAAASRAARRAKCFSKHLYATKHTHTTAAINAMYGTLMRFTFRADVLKYKYFDAAYESQRAALSKLAA